MMYSCVCALERGKEGADYILSEQELNRVMNVLSLGKYFDVFIRISSIWVYKNFIYIYTF